MKNKVFGLDIGVTSVKVVALHREGKGLFYDASMSYPSPSKGMLSESPVDQEEMAQTIRKVVLDAKIEAVSANVALPDNQVFTKVVEMPVLSDKELSSAIYWEAEQYIPASLDTMTLDWKILRRQPEAQTEPKMQVLLVAAQNAVVGKYQNVLSMAGFTINAVETEILSVIRGVLLSGSTQTVFIINVGALSTSIAIVQEGIIIFTYAIPLGGIAMDRSIATDFGFTPAQAEEYRKIYGISDKNLGGKIGKAVEPVLSSILSEVKKAISFYQDKHKNDTPLTQVLLSGASASLPGIDLYFAQNTGIETVIANPWKLLGISNVPPEVMSNGPEYAIAVGLAMKEYE